jgi:GH24 family phage-related lysozyme (muramidase)
MNIRYNIVVVTAEDNLSCHCDTQQDAHHEDGITSFDYNIGTT